MRPLLAITVFVAVVTSACDDDGPPPPPRKRPVVSTLDVAKAGDGRGVVRTLPAGLICDVDCDGGSFDYEDVEALTVVAELGRNANFEELRCQHGDDAPLVKDALDEAGGDEATLELPTIVDGEGQDWSCTASFLLVHTVQVLASDGSGAGGVRGALSASVGSDEPRRIDCTTRREGDERILEGDAIGAYFDGDVETLTATPAPGSVFVDWDTCDVDEPTNPVLVLTVDDDFNCRANFDLE
jgi:hypothetical protein